jgi:hypothetical protein
LDSDTALHHFLVPNLLARLVGVIDKGPNSKLAVQIDDYCHFRGEGNVSTIDPRDLLPRFERLKQLLVDDPRSTQSLATDPAVVGQLQALELPCLIEYHMRGVRTAGESFIRRLHLLRASLRKVGKLDLASLLLSGGTFATRPVEDPSSSVSGRKTILFLALRTLSDLLPILKASAAEEGKLWKQEQAHAACQRAIGQTLQNSGVRSCALHGCASEFSEPKSALAKGGRTSFSADLIAQLRGVEIRVSAERIQAFTGETSETDFYPIASPIFQGCVCARCLCWMRRVSPSCVLKSESERVLAIRAELAASGHVQLDLVRDKGGVGNAVGSGEGESNTNFKPGKIRDPQLVTEYLTELVRKITWPKSGPTCTLLSEAMKKDGSKVLRDPLAGFWKEHGDQIKSDFFSRG